jgi:hypothetical protein
LSARLWAAVPGDAGDRRAGTCVLQEQKLDSNTHRLPPRSQFCRQVRLVSHPTTLVFALPTGIEGSTLLKHVISASSLRDVFCVSRNRHSGGMRDLGESVKPSKPSNHTLPSRKLIHSKSSPTIPFFAFSFIGGGLPRCIWHIQGFCDSSLAAARWTSGSIWAFEIDHPRKTGLLERPSPSTC